MPKKVGRTATTVATKPTPPAVTAPQAPQAQGSNGAIPTAKYVEMALDALGDSTTAQVKAWINERYPEVNTDIAGFQSCVSVKRAKKFGARAYNTQRQFSIESLKKIKEVAQNHGGIDAFYKEVEELAELTRETNGLQGLLKCLDFIRELNS